MMRFFKYRPCLYADAGFNLMMRIWGALKRAKMMRQRNQSEPMISHSSHVMLDSQYHGLSKEICPRTVGGEATFSNVVSANGLQQHQ
jgi:hypothetical protein